MKLENFLAMCDEQLVVCIWDAQDDRFLGEYHGAGIIDRVFKEWTVVKILGSGKANLIDVVIREQ